MKTFGHFIKSCMLGAFIAVMLGHTAAAFDPSKSNRYPSPDLYRPNADDLLINGSGPTGGEVAVRSLINRLRDNGVSVLSYGASVGTGGDDSAAINSALRDSCNFGQQLNPSAKTCRLIFPEPPSGAYNVCANPIVLPGYWASVSLQGTGAAPKIRVLPGCQSGIQSIVYQDFHAGDSSSARVYIDNLTLDGYCIAPNNLSLGYTVGLQVTRTIFRNTKGGAGNANVYIGGGYENSIDKSNRAENVNEPGHVCYNSNADLPDYNLFVKTSDSWYGLAAIDAKIANYYNAAGGNNHYADAHGWGFTGPWPNFSTSNLAPQYTFLVVGNADINDAVMDSPQKAGIYLKGGLDGNNVPTTISNAIVSGTSIFGNPTGTPAVLLDTGLGYTTIVGNNWSNQQTAVQTISGPVVASNTIANNGDFLPVTSALTAAPVPNGDAAIISANGAGGGVVFFAQSPKPDSSVFISAKGQGAVQLNSNSALALSAYADLGAVNALNITATPTGTPPVLQVTGNDTNTSLSLLGKGNSGVLTGYFVRAADPTGGDIPQGQCADWQNTTANTFKHWCNFPGAGLKSVTMN